MLNYISQLHLLALTSCTFALPLPATPLPSPFPAAPCLALTSCCSFLLPLPAAVPLPCPYQLLYLYLALTICCTVPLPCPYQLLYQCTFTLQCPAVSVWLRSGWGGAAGDGAQVPAPAGPGGQGPGGQAHQLQELSAADEVGHPAQGREYWQSGGCGLGYGGQKSSAAQGEVSISFFLNNVGFFPISLMFG